MISSEGGVESPEPAGGVGGVAGGGVGVGGSGGGATGGGVTVGRRVTAMV